MNRVRRRDGFGLFLFCHEVKLSIFKEKLNFMFHANQPLIIDNTLPLDFIMPLVPIFSLKLSVVEPRKETDNMYIKVQPCTEFKIGEGWPILYKFESKSEFFTAPVFEKKQRYKQIYSYILTGILNHNDLFSIDHPSIRGLNGLEIIFENPPEKEAEEFIKKTIFINSTN